MVLRQRVHTSMPWCFCRFTRCRRNVLILEWLRLAAFFAPFPQRVQDWPIEQEVIDISRKKRYTPFRFFSKCAQYISFYLSVKAYGIVFRSLLFSHYHSLSYSS